MAYIIDDTRTESDQRAADTRGERPLVSGRDPHPRGFTRCLCRLLITLARSGDVTETHVLWRTAKGSNASSPIYHDGTLYWTSESGGILHIQDAATGKSVEHRLGPDVGRTWASPILADGKLYFVSQFKGTYVVAAQPKFELLARNVFDDDSSRSNASLAVSDGQLFLRNDLYLYCIGKR